MAVAVPVLVVLPAATRYVFPLCYRIRYGWLVSRSQSGRTDGVLPACLPPLPRLDYLPRCRSFDFVPVQYSVVAPPARSPPLPATCIYQLVR